LKEVSAMRKVSPISWAILIIACLLCTKAFQSEGRCSEGKISSGAMGWRVDEDLKVHVAYYGGDDEKSLTKSNSRPASPLAFTAPWQADITNINLKSICDLGFPLPRGTDPEQYSFFLKFFEYPGSLDHQRTLRSCLEPLLVLDTSAGAELRRFIREKKHVVVKKGLIDKTSRAFTESDPFPALRVAVKPLRLSGHTVAPQEFFDVHIPFSTLYVKPAGAHPPVKGDDREAAEASAQGVVAFHREILSLYERAYFPLRDEGAAEHWFVDRLAGKKRSEARSIVRIIRVPKKPMIFTNFRSLPMPQDPDHIFLAGLLLIYADEYRLTAQPEAEASGALVLLRKEAELVRSHVFEVGSVIDLRNLRQ
jgi:hypothetical protein